MNTKIKKEIRFYGPWAAEQEVEWLNRMASQGWQLKDVSFLLYRFVPAQVNRQLYQLDFQDVAKEQWQDYIDLFAEAGWEYVTSISNWHYFRGDANNPALQPLHTDNESKLAMLKRVLTTLLITGWLPVFYLIFFYPDYRHNMESAFSRTAADIVGLIFGFTCLVLLYSFLRLNLMIGKLQKQLRE